MVDVEKEFHEIRSELARRYGVENELNRVTASAADAWLGIVATGYTYTQVLESLRCLGLANLGEIGRAGIRLLHLRMPVPISADQVVDFARGLTEIIVVEEKNPTLERLVRDCLYDTTERPRVIGKTAPDGSMLLPSYGLLDADAITPALRSRLEGVLGDRLAGPQPQPRELISLTITRTPFFCSGCPHNWGTKVPEGAVVGMGTGCHGMTFLMDEERVGESLGITAMGNEGAQWLDMAPFVDTTHIFQNFGDGTYFHSGQLAIQAAIGAGANVTFKVLYNHTVAMTGGQDPSHRLEPTDLASVLLTQGAKQVTITTENVSRYRGVKLPRDVKVVDRTEIVAVQEQLASVTGVTILIHDQECSNELRRARRRGTVTRPTKRVVINHRICEGCGDCGDVSNCLSVQPVDTPLGPKTRIDQDSCNFDWSCLDGDCPAFMTVEVANEGVAQTHEADLDPNTIDVADPSPTDRVTTTIRMAGIGGTGVVTTAQILGTAAMLSGLEVDAVDQTGLPQKAGPVVSDLTLTRSGNPRRSNLVGTNQADVIIAFDMLVASSDTTIGVGSSATTTVFASSSTTPTGAQISQPGISYPTHGELSGRLEARTSRSFVVDARLLADTLTGNAATANTLLLGVAIQAGEIPVELDAVEEAIRLNGVAVEANIAALEWGRRWFADAPAVESMSRSRDMSLLRVDTPELSEKLRSRLGALSLGGPLDDAVQMLTADLVGYQNEAYAKRFLDLVERTCHLDDDELTEAVARNFHKLMAYKDEYEVARLMLSDDGLASANSLAAGGTGRPRMTWHLHPPLLRALGLKRKLRFSTKLAPLVGLLAKGKRLRGKSLDPFGRSAVRRIERTMIDEYEVAVIAVVEHLDDTPNADAWQGARDLVELPDSVRGYEELKMKRAEAYRHRLAESLEELLGAARVGRSAATTESEAWVVQSAQRRG